MTVSIPAIRGLLFDKDGTLFDYHSTWAPWAQGFVALIANGDERLAGLIADALGFDRGAGAFRPDSPFIAGTTDEVLDFILTALPALSRTELEDTYCRTVAAADLNPPVPLAPLFAEFRVLGLRLGVSTNDHELAAHGQLQKAGVEGAFDFIAGFDSGYGAKPAPGMQLAFCEQMALEPAHVAMVGDSLHDLVAGQRAGMVPLAVLTGTATAQDLAPHAAHVFDHIGQIPAWLRDQKGV